MPKHAEAGEEEVGEVFTFFSKVGVAGIKLKGTLNVGDRIRLKGSTTNFEQTVDSMQVEHTPVQSAGNGDSIGVKMVDRVRPGDKVLRLS